MKFPTKCSRIALSVFAGSACLLATACGGGGGTPSPSPAPANAVPQFTSGTTATVAENSTGTVYTATATDADGDPLTFTIAGGPDASAFTLSGGALSFVTSPNFDLFADANNDNVYSVTLRVADGRGGMAALALAITVTNDREGIRVTRISAAGGMPVSIARTNSANQLLLADAGGALFFVDGSTGTKTAVPGYTPPVGLQLLGAAFGPDNAFFKGPVLIVKSATSIGLYRPLAGSRIDADLAAGDTAGVRGSVYFDTAGRLFAAIGDSAPSTAQADDGFAATGFGKLYFADPAAGAGASLRPIPIVRIAKGIRQPGGIAEIGNQLLLADQGEGAEQEASAFAFDAGPYNLGWPFFEGRTQRQTGAPAGLTGPKLAYPFGTGARAGTGIVAGRSYTGSIAGIAGQFVFGDRSGKIWSIPASKLAGGAQLTIADIEDRTADFAPDVGTLDEIVEIAADASGVLYILDADGEIFRVDPA